MSLIRTNYHTLRFPLRDTNPEAVLALYRTEFAITGDIGERELVTLFANALHDYLAARLTENAFASLCFALVSNKNIDTVLKSSLPELRPVILDCVDIAWLSSGAHFDDFKTHLSSILDALKSKHTDTP